jgi:PilZ domain
MQQRDIRTRVSHSRVQLVKTPNEQKKNEYNVLNISRGGLCFECNADEFELNDVMTLNLIVDEHSIHKANARVCYCNLTAAKNSAQYGLSFLDKFIDVEVIRESCR